MNDINDNDNNSSKGDNNEIDNDNIMRWNNSDIINKIK